MKFKIKRMVLLEALNTVSKVISNQIGTPARSGIKFELMNDKLVMTATDKDGIIVIQTYIDKSDNLIIEDTGAIIIKAKYILDIVRKLDTEFINIELIDNHKIMIFTDNSKFILNGIDIQYYDNVDFNLSTEFVEMDLAVFKDMILKTNYACSLDEKNISLTGVNIKINNNLLECCATNSSRMAYIKHQLNSDSNIVADIIIPSKNLNELLKVMSFDSDHDDNKIKIYLFNNKIIFSFNNILFKSSIIGEKYGVNTDALLSKEVVLNLEVDTNDFYRMVDRASILSDVESTNIIILEIENGILKVSSKSYEEVGKIVEKMNINCSSQLRTSFLAKYLLDALKTIKSKSVVLSFFNISGLKHENAGVFIKNSDNDDLICLVIPTQEHHFLSNDD